MSQGCTAKTEDLTITARLWSKEYEQQVVRKEILDPYYDETGIRVKLEIHDDHYMQNNIAQISRECDILITYFSNIDFYIQHKLASDLTEEVSSWKHHTFSVPLQGVLQREGRTHFLPIGADVYVSTVRKEALEYLPPGAAPEDLEWADVLAWQEQILRETGSGRLAFSGRPGSNFTYQAACLLGSYNSPFPAANTGGARRSWQLLEEMSPYFIESVLETDQVAEALRDGRGWWGICHISQAGMLLQEMPEAIDVHKVPAGPAGRGVIAGLNAVTVNPQSPHQKEATAFLRYLTSPEVQLKMSRTGAAFIPTVEEALQQLGDTREDRLLRQGIQTIQEGRLIFLPQTRPGQSWGDVKAIYDEILHTIQTTGKVPPAEDLQAYENDLDTLVYR